MGERWSGGQNHQFFLSDLEEPRSAGWPGLRGGVRTAERPRFVPIHQYLHAPGRGMRGMRAQAGRSVPNFRCVWGRLRRRLAVT